MKNKNPLLALLTLMLVLILGYGITWAVVVGIVKLTTLCFGGEFSLPHATLTWLVLVLLWSIFYPRKKEK